MVVPTATVGRLARQLPGSHGDRAALAHAFVRFALKGRDLSHLKGRLILIHGSEDTMIPHSESVALANAVPDTELYVIDGFSHIDPTHTPILGQLQLIDAVQAILRRRTHERMGGSLLKCGPPPARG